MSFAAVLRHWFAGSRRERAASSSRSAAEPPPIDVERLARELGLIDEAARLGAAGLPDAQAQSLSGPEALVVQRVAQARREHVERAARRLGVLDRDLARRDVTAAVNRAREAARAFERAASGLLAQQEAVLRELQAAAAARAAELEAFRASHRLVRAPDVPSTGRLVLLYGVLLLMVAIEGIANAFFFAEGVSTGLVGGFVFAAAFAAANVATAFLFGKFALRQAAHVHPARRALGLLAVPAAVGAMLCVALATAHMRDALAIDAADAPALALRTLRETPFALAGLSSWALFAASLLFGAVALLDGLHTDDRYPGYGRAARRARLAQDDCAAEIEALRDELEALRAEHLAAFERDLREARSALLVQESLVGDKRAAAGRLANALRDAEHAQAALLRRFRTENELHRAGAPRPAYFDALPAPEPLAQPEFHLAADEAALAQGRAQLDALLAEAEALRAQIQGAFIGQVDALTPLAAQFAPRADA